MGIRLKVGTVVPTGDATRTGTFKAIFNKGSAAEPVKYVTPYGNTNEAFVAIPNPGSTVLCAFDDSLATVDEVQGNFYLGSVMGPIEGFNISVSNEKPSPSPEIFPSGRHIPSNKVGLHGPTVPYGSIGQNTPNQYGTFPEMFKDMYDGRAVVAQAIGLSNERADGLKIASRQSVPIDGSEPFQDYRVSLKTGSGKRFEMVDSPIVNGIVMSNEHRGKDYFIWSSKSSKESPYAAGEYHLRTHGPINLFTLANGFNMWVEDGLNMNLENKSTGAKAYGDISSNPDGRVDEDGAPINGLGDPGTGGYKATRRKVFGNETTGCINLISHHNNIHLRATEVDSVIRVHAPGAHSRVIVDTGGSVDINARGKLTLQSNTEVEINAPIVDIKGDKSMSLNSPRLDLNDWDSGDDPKYIPNEK